MKGKTNNPNGRPPLKEEERRIRVSFRLKPKTIEWLRREAEEKGVSQTALIDGLAEDKER